MNKYMLYSLLMLLALLFTGCVNEMDAPSATGNGGRLQLTLGNISTATRGTPSELGVPTAADFNVRVLNTVGRAVYDSAYCDTELSVPIGTYDIIAELGDNPSLAYDSPYYVGTATAVVEENQTTAVTIPCKVGNALVSAYFGEDETMQERFNRFYSSYALRVSVGNYSMNIDNVHPDYSVYMRAGSKVSLKFYGHYIPMDEDVVMDIALPDDVSATLGAADHLKVTLSVREVGNEADVIVSKAEVEKMDIEQSLSYNWLPAPTLTTEHVYSNNGLLLGTDITTSTSFPGATWTAQIHQGSATGTIVRTLTGTGALSQAYTEDENWPFLPAGTYVATFSYTGKQGGTYNFSKTRTFTVPQPTLTLTADCYTSYSKYLEGDISMANACERLTVYNPSAVFSVDNSLLANENYARTYTYSISSQSTTVTADSNTPVWAKITNVPVSGNLYDFKVIAAFCGQNVTATKQVRITGLPYSLNLSSHSEWDEDGSVTWDSDNVRLGYYTTGDQSITTNSSVYIPQGTKYCADYEVNVHTGTVGTTFSITAGSQVILSIKESGGTFLVGTDHISSGTTTTFSANSNITSLTCKNSYGAGATCSYLSLLIFKYAE